jgi:dimethylargininase
MLTAVTRAVSRSLARCELTWLRREPIDIGKARTQHRAYEQCLEELGVRVISLPALEAHPDAVFVEDPALVLDEVAVIASMGCESRRGERASLAEVLSKFRPLIHMRDPARLEGGDVLRIGRELFVGLSARTDEPGVEQLAAELRPFGYRVTAVKLRDCLHLKSACSSIGQGTLLIHKAWLDVAPLVPYRFLEVAPDEPGAANALLVNGTVVLPSSFPKTAESLARAGFKVRLVDVSELLKAESGVTCSSLVFDV